MCDTIDKIKIVEGIDESAAINSAGKLVLWKHKNKGYETYETNINCKDLCLYNDGKKLRWVIIDEFNQLNYVNIYPTEGYKRTINWNLSLEEMFIKGTKVLSIPSRSNMLILTEAGIFQAFGKNTIPFPTNPEVDTVFTDFALSEKFAVGLTHTGLLFTWGEYEAGNLEVPLRFYSPSEYIDTGPNGPLINGPKITKIVSGKNVVLVLYENGKVDGWGNNKYKQLNIPDLIAKDSMSNVFVRDIAISNSLCFAYVEFLDSSEYNSIIYWGEKNYVPYQNVSVSKFKYSVESPYFFDTTNLFFTKVRQLFCGRNAIYGVLVDGKVISWGLTGAQADVYVPDLYVKSKSYVGLPIGRYGFNTEINQLIKKINKQSVTTEDFSYVLEGFKLDKITTADDIKVLRSRGTIRSNFQLLDSSGNTIMNFEKQKFLGAGTYGAVYSIQDTTTNKYYTIKVPRNLGSGSSGSLNDFTEEILTQLILYNQSSDYIEGPICGEILAVALLESEGDFGSDSTFFPVIIQEEIYSTLGNYYFKNRYEILTNVSLTQERRESRLVTLEKNLLQGIAMLCGKLNYLNKLQAFEFNHRDMKSDNIMVNIKADGSIQNIFLIDFGLSCLNIKGHNLGSSKMGGLFRKAKCFNPTRDLSFLINSIIQFFRDKDTKISYLSENTQQFLQNVTTFYVKNKLCNMSKGCDYEISNNPSLTDFNKIDPITGVNNSTIFSQSYFFLNKNYIFNPKTTPSNLITLIKDYITSGFNPEIVNKYVPLIGEFPINDKTSSKVSELKNFETFPEVPEISEVPESSDVPERASNEPSGPLTTSSSNDVQDENIAPNVINKSFEL
jgi:serine/threonine protein kinase